MVHTSLGKIGYVCGGAQAVIEALIGYYRNRIILTQPDGIERSRYLR